MEWNNSGERAAGNFCRKLQYIAQFVAITAERMSYRASG